MIRFYSKGCQYVLKVLSGLDASKEPGRNFSVKRVCRQLNLPESYTRKLFQALVKKGILKASQGPGGGYQLKVSPRRISVLGIIQAIDGKRALETCIMGKPTCQYRHRQCALHAFWGPIRRTVVRQLGEVTLQELMDQKKNLKRIERGELP